MWQSIVENVWMNWFFQRIYHQLSKAKEQPHDFGCFDKLSASEKEYLKYIDYFETFRYTVKFMRFSVSTYYFLERYSNITNKFKNLFHF